jgi:predicted metal-dependent hydrolase
MIYQKDKVKYGTSTISYRVIKTGRVKTSEVIVDADSITVRAPLEKDKLEIQKLILDKARWISQKQREYRESKPQITKPLFKENSTLPYHGRNYPLKINKNRKRNAIELIDEKFVVGLKSAEPSSKIIKRLYENWLKEKAKPVFETKVKEYSMRLEVSVNLMVIKNLKNRWGSLTKNNNLNLNVNLLKAPEDVIEYIILHELCHIRIKEHSHYYWDMLRKFMPNYQDKIEWLNMNGNNLL